MLKKMFSWLIVFSVIVGANVSAYAMESGDFDYNQSYEIEIPIYSEEEGIPQDEGVLYVDTTDGTTRATEAAEIKYYASREDDSDQVEIWLNYSGTVNSDGFRFKKLTVANRSSLVGVTYGTVGNGKTFTTYYVPTGMTYTHLVTTVTVPTNIDAVKITIADLQIACKNHSDWHSTYGAASSIVNIKR